MGSHRALPPLIAIDCVQTMTIGGSERAARAATIIGFDSRMGQTTAFRFMEFVAQTLLFLGNNSPQQVDELRILGKSATASLAFQLPILPSAIRLGRDAPIAGAIPGV
jgi:hypothetical protein